MSALVELPQPQNENELQDLVNVARVRALLEMVTDEFDKKPFVPPPIFAQRDAQTIGAFLWPGRFRRRDDSGDEARLFAVEPGTRVLAHCRWHAQRTDHATLVAWHGLEGSTNSAYMLSIAEKAYGAGFNVVRVNVRNCGATEHLTPTLYHAGQTDDLRAVIAELIEQDRLSRLFVVGFSLGGNLVLKMAGEYGDDPPAEIKGVVAVSPSIDLRASCDLTNQPRNWLYQYEFLRHLKRRLKLKQRLFPDLYDVAGLERVRTIEQFDDCYVAPAFGFENVSDYYARASSLPFIGQIRIPTLIIHAEDDPFIPFEPLRDPSIAANPYVLLVTTERGGHVAFVSANTDHEDRFWAENRVVEFCRMAAESRPEATSRSSSTADQRDCER
ncbi:MAG TPA: alpha/beta fold hydrolase [Pyrinomonadaceae bacterium]|nr:alpha/beta fold hydrolase [Pyrinomonadaceae bacterium]